jgi:hypothetical protein
MKIFLIILIFVSSICSQILSDYHFFNGHWYAATLESISWAKANEFANKQTYFDSLSRQKLYGHLVTITSAQEQQFIAKTYVNKEWTHAWLGAHRVPYSDSTSLTEGWVWVTGEIWDYTNWSTGQPEKASEECLSMMNYTNGNWHDYIDTIAFDPGYRYTIVEFESLTSSVSQKNEKQIYSIVNKDFVKIILQEECKSIKVVDLKSRVICQLRSSKCVFWDYRDASGKRVASGNYFIILQSDKFKIIHVKIF